MPDDQFATLLVALQNCEILTDKELGLITSGDWSLANVLPPRSPKEMRAFQMAAAALLARAGVATGTIEWLEWVKSPQGVLHTCLVARVVHVTENRTAKLPCAEDAFTPAF